MIRMEIGPADMDGISVVKDRALLLYLMTIFFYIFCCSEHHAL